MTATDIPAPTDRVARDQHNRVRMIGVSAVNYLFGILTMSLYALIGTVGWDIPALYAVASMGGSAVFFLLVRRGANLRLRDPNLFGWQMAHGGLVALTFLSVAPQLAFASLSSLFVTGVFGLVQFGLPEFRRALLVVGAGSAAIFYFVWDRLALPASTPHEALVLWVLLMFLLGRFTVVAAHVGLLRKKLHERNRQLQESLDRIQELLLGRARKEQELAVAQERQRLMREIHDGIGASLNTSLAMIERGRMDRHSLAAVVRECIDELKLTIDSLEPMENDLVAVIATLRYRLEKRLLAAGIRMEWQVQELPALPWLEVTQALSIMRVLQEALSNVVRHSRATSVAVRTAEQAHDGRSGVEVSIADDGVGFDAAVAQSYGHGLRNMRERAAGLGGQLTIESAPGRSVVRLWLPLAAPAMAQDAGAHRAPAALTAAGER
ncbi:sensor histidine kinase [Schlegelella sp. S2-27]|uniref:histidine kinase n=1 Tax=Caldimonas mangrovi TaxID=2944811 RepID=A0ABT0YTB2_9BURK|nr:sensor histidine kinase [Caldimonas mangrovi]MCM5681970.1 sensor histidine kinase [Caldimonas mangrovi]